MNSRSSLVTQALRWYIIYYDMMRNKVYLSYTSTKRFRRRVQLQILNPC